VSADATGGENVAASAGDGSPASAAPDACEAALTELTPAELGAWRGMLRVHAALAKALDAELEAAHGLPLTSYEVLITLAAAPERRLRMAELADRVLLSRSGMTRLCDRLEREGLLERTTCDSDGRGLFAVLTDAGGELVARARPVHLDGVRERFLRHFAEDELRVLAGWWERVLPGAAESGR
jgi:DNA-binding MarR family transcriptional regulator